MPGSPGVTYGNAFRSAIGEFNESLARPGVEDDIDGSAVEVSRELQVSDLGPRHHEAAEAVPKKELRDRRGVIHAELSWRIPASHPPLKLRCQEVVHVRERLLREGGIHHGGPALCIESVLDHGAGVREFDESGFTAQAPDAAVVGTAEGQ